MRRARIETGVPVRHHVMVHEVLWTHFHKRWAEIDLEWRGGLTVGVVQESPGILDAVALGIRAAREELRAEVKALASKFPGQFLVPV